MEQKNSSGSNSTLELLAQYNDHRSQKEKAIEHIEGITGNEAYKSNYDELLKENVLLKLQNKRLVSEVETLHKVIDALKAGKPIPSASTLSQIIEKQDEEQPKEPILPPRSAERKRNAKNLFLPVSPLPHGQTPHIDVTEDGQLNEQRELPHIDTAPSIPNASGSGLVGNNPASSATYTSSRITVSHPTSPRRPLVENRIRSPQSANRAATVINNQLHSPMSSALGGETSINLTTGSGRLPSPPTEMEEEFGLVKKSFSKSSDVSLHGKANEFSPASKQNLNNFAEYLEDTFRDEEAQSIDTNIADDTMMERTSSEVARNNMPQHAPPPVPHPQEIEASSQHSTLQLGSPVMLNRKDQPHTQNRDGNQMKSPLSMSFANSRSRDNVSEQAISKAVSGETLSVKSSTTAASTASHADTGTRIRRPHAASVSTVGSSAQSIASDIPLFVQPDEFDTIRMEVLSSLFFETETSDHPKILFTVIDRSSDKDIFKFAKTVKKLYDLDAYLRQRLPSSTLPPLPDRQTFDTLMPVKVDSRREKLNHYFTALFKILELAPVLNLRVAQFMSTDTVMNPVMVGDTAKEGSLLMRRAKTLGNGSNWRVRYGVLRGEILQLFDRDQLAESINLKQSNIELLPNLPEDRFGTKNGFLVNEHKKSGLSSTIKYYLCAETSKERELWVTAVSEYAMSPIPLPSSSSGPAATSSSPATTSAGPTVTSAAAVEDATSSLANKSEYSVDQIYVTDLTEPRVISSSTESTLSSPRIASDPGDEDKENRRLKMRSFFPFKKLTSNAFGMGSDDTETMASQDSEPKYSDNSIAKSLETLNLLEQTSTAVFGSPLDKCLKLSSHTYQNKYEIPSVVYRCLEFLYKNRGIQEEGIFRLSGSSALIKSLQEQFDKEYDMDLCTYNEKVADGTGGSNSLGMYIDVNTVSGLLKLYLRKLPHMIFGEEQYPMFKKVVDENHDNPAQVALEFRNLINSDVVPAANTSLMYALFELLVRINENNRANKMNLRNLCIIFSPTLNIPVTILQPFIIDFSCIFQDGQPVEQYLREKIDLHIPGV
ncbi:BEM3 (YPL115C) [Zygosaccharomyces parabailii]|nr:BEM3 (YPL115C) [Zygosaccharomyces parabailii]